MPLKIIKLPNNWYSVVNQTTGHIHAHETTLEKAQRQIRIIELLDKVKRRLKELKIPYDSVSLSPKPDKKIRIIINNKPVDFGSKDSTTYLEGASEQKREAYIARHSKIYLKDGTRAIDKLYSPAWFAIKILW